MNDQTKRILIISLFFPPSTIVGGRRFAFLSRILIERHPELHILTLKEKYISPKDHSLPGVGIIHRTGMFPPYPIRTTNIFKRIINRLWVDYFCLVDAWSGWILPALVKGLKIIKTHKIDLIIATCPMFSPMVIGFLLSLITRTKLIMDYRDPWTNHDRKYSKLLGKRINELFERLLIRRASAQVFCSHIMKQNFINSLGKYAKASCHVVPNGFHYRDTIEPLSLGEAQKNVVYAGSFYGQRKIKLLAKPLLKLLNEDSITKDAFCFHIFGKLNNEDREVVRKYDLQDIIKEHPPAPYVQMIKYMKAADILLLLSGSDVKYAIPFKFYDYLSVKRPILALASDDSAVAELMNEIDCGRFASINSEESVLKNLRRMILENKEYTYLGADEYSWEKIGHKYIDVIDKVMIS